MKLDSLLQDAFLAQDKELLEAAAQTPHRFSSHYHRKMRRMCHPDSGARRFSRRLVVTIFAAVLLIGSVTTVAFWSELQLFFQVSFPGYVGLQSTPSVQPSQNFYDLPDDWGAVWLPAKLPEEYTFLSASVQQHVQKIQYLSASGDVLIFSQSQNTSGKFEDSDGAVIHNLTVGSSVAYAWEKLYSDETINNLVWTADNTTYTLSGILSFDELVEIGESLQLTEIGE